MSESTADAIIIGAGIIGSSIALELSRLGYRTLSLDAHGAPGHGSTSDSAAIIRVYASAPEMTALAWETIPVWEDWGSHVGVVDELGLAQYVRTGSLVIDHPGADLDSMHDILSRMNIDKEMWDLDAMTAHLPGFDLHAFWPPSPVDEERFWDEPTEFLQRALFVPEAGYLVDGALAAHNLATAARATGAVFRYGAEVIGIRQTGGAVCGVTLADGTCLDAPVVINVAGPHSAAINRLARVEEGMRVSTRPMRHELHVVPAPPSVQTGGAGLCISDGDLAVNFRPEPGGHILVGGEDPDCDPVIGPSDPDDFDRNASVAQWERQVLRLARRIPELQIPSRPRGLAGLYDASDDWLPIYDRSDLDGFYMAIGSSGTQLKAAPTVGYLMSRLIDACEAGHDHDANPLIVRTPHRNLDIDLGAFSRRREPRLSAGFI